MLTGRGPARWDSCTQCLTSRPQFSLAHPALCAPVERDGATLACSPSGAMLSSWYPLTSAESWFTSMELEGVPDSIPLRRDLLRLGLDIVHRGRLRLHVAVQG